MKKRSNNLVRGAGVLMPISSLPGGFGIGTLGAEAYRFVDFVCRNGFKYWQVLPVGPTSYGDSPYQSFSAFAGNPYFIDLDTLAEEGCLEKGTYEEIKWGKIKNEVDYAAIFTHRFPVLKEAFGNSRHLDDKEYKEFLEETKFWLEDYAFYMALKYHFDQASWQEWEEDIKFLKPSAVKKYKKLLSAEIDFWKFLQYKFRQQWMKLKKYANDKGVMIIGDIPLYVALDSADVWVNKQNYAIDEKGKETSIAGVPPDMFSATGQRWGNPIYNWDVMEETGFSWWRERMKANASFYDVIRIDHFIGIVNYWSIPAECETAIDGEWLKGPGEKLTNAISESIGDAKLIAEDLGVLTKPVVNLIQKTGYPGMKIIEFGLDGPADNQYLPHNYSKSNIIAYIGTHDNETLAGYLKGLKRKQKSFVKEYYGVKREKDLHKVIVRSLFSCIGDVVIIQMQDMLSLDNSARMNLPSTVGINWKWKMDAEQYGEIDTEYYKKLCEIYCR